MNNEFNNLTDDEVFAIAGKAQIKLHQCAQNGGETTLNQTEILAFMRVAAKQMFPSRTITAPDDWSVFEAAEDETLSDSPPVPLYSMPPQVEMFKSELDFVTGKTLEEFKINFNSLLQDDPYVHFAGEIKRTAKIGFYAPVYCSRQISDGQEQTDTDTENL